MSNAIDGILEIDESSSSPEQSAVDELVVRADGHVHGAALRLQLGLTLLAAIGTNGIFPATVSHGIGN